MRLNKINDTCSMFELGNFDCSGLKKKGYSKYDFSKFVIEEFKRLETNKKKYSILYNCDNHENYKFLKKLGFKQIARYRGYEDVKVMIYCSKPYSLIEKILLFFNLQI